jgi:hypothetical protein
MSDAIQFIRSGNGLLLNDGQPGSNPQVLINALTGEVKHYFKWTVTRLTRSYQFRCIVCIEFLNNVNLFSVISGLTGHSDGIWLLHPPHSEGHESRPRSTRHLAPDLPITL